MDPTYWQKQTNDQPLFHDLLWSRPENKRHAGKLLIIGGNSFGFASPGEAYAESVKAGVGTSRVVLPNAVKKVAGNIFPGVEFADSNPSGSFSKSAIASWLEHASWSDGTLLAGNLGRNSEVAILLESFIQKYKGQLTITNDAGDYCIALAKQVIDRPGTLLVITMAQLQKIAINTNFSTAITLSMDLLRLTDALHVFSQLHPVIIVVKHLEQIVVAYDGKVSTTPNTSEMWRTVTASKASVWWIQNPNKPFESITTSII